MKRILALIGVLAFIPLLGVFLLWYWVMPHKSTLVRRAERGEVQAIFEVGMAHLSISGEGIVKRGEKREPVFWLRKAAEKGYVGAMWVLSGVGGIPNEEKVMWLKKGAELGSKACMIEIQKGYTYGMYGLPNDSRMAEEWQKKVRTACEDELRRQGYDVPHPK